MKRISIVVIAATVVATIAIFPLSASAMPLESVGVLFGGGFCTRSFASDLTWNRGPVGYRGCGTLAGSLEWRLPWAELGLLSEIGWQQKGLSQTSSSGAECGVIDEYLSVPILLERGLPSLAAGGLRPYAVLGVALDYRLTELEKRVVSPDAPSRWAPSLRVGGGLKLRERVELRAVYSRDLRSSSGYNTAPALDTVRNSGIMIVGGIRMPLQGE